MSNPSGRYSVAVAAVALLSATTAQALELDWHAPAGCPDATSVKRHVQRLAGVAEGASLVARAVVTQTVAQRWRVSINLSGSATGHRTLTADTCPQLARASALIIALAANPEAALDLPSDEQSSPPLPTPPTQPSRPASQTTPSVEPPSHRDTEPERQVPPPNAAPQPESRPTESAPTPAPEPKPMDSEKDSDRAGRNIPEAPGRFSDRGIDVFARAGFERGALPTDTGWLGIGVRLRSSRLPLSVTLSTYATQGTSATFTNGIGANFRLFAGQALICLQPNTHRWFIAGCGGVQLSMTRAAGFIHSVGGSPITEDGEYFVRYRWTPAPLFALALGYQVLPPFTVEIGGGIALPLQRLAYVVQDVGLLARPERQQMLLHAGIGLAL